MLLQGGAAILVSRFDMLMIEHYLDLKQVAYYGLAFCVVLLEYLLVPFLLYPLL